MPHLLVSLALFFTVSTLSLLFVAMTNGAVKRKNVLSDNAENPKRAKLNSTEASAQPEHLQSPGSPATEIPVPSGSATHIEQCPPLPVTATDPPPEIVMNDRITGETVESSAGLPSKKGKEKANAPSSEAESSVKPAYKINKLVPARPFPTVPTSVSATGPRSAHHEGKNYIAVTRKTPLGAYLRRCKDVVLKDGYVEDSIIIFFPI